MVYEIGEECAREGMGSGQRDETPTLDPRKNWCCTISAVNSCCAIMYHPSNRESQGYVQSDS